MATGSRRSPGRRSEPRRFLQRNVPRKWRYRLAPALGPPPPPSRLSVLWTRARRLLFEWWIWGAAAIWSAWRDDWWTAALTGVVAGFVHLASPRRHPLIRGLEHRMALGSAAFVDSIEGTTGTPFMAGNRVTILNNGDEFYPAMLDAIGGARQSVTIESYIYWGGHIGLRFAQALAERARAGVTVKILLDAVGSATIGDEILAVLGSSGCQLAWFRPIRWYTLARFNQRTHRKTLLIDGRIAFTGGAGIADQWCGDAQNPGHWRDVQVQVEGPAVIALQHGFVVNWLQTTGEMVTGPAFFPRPEPAGDVAVQTVMSSPTTGSSAVRTLYLLSIASARRSILIANPYFIPDVEALEALGQASRRGVEVQVLVSGIRNDNWLARHNSVRLFGHLLESGIALFEYNRTMLHQKTMIVDGIWATIGTANFDNRSFRLNEESNITFFDTTLVGRMTRTFEDDVAHADPVDLERWRRRGVWAQAQEVMASVLQDQA